MRKSAAEAERSRVAIGLPLRPRNVPEKLKQQAPDSSSQAKVYG